jgi:hypothetical protein
MPPFPLTTLRALLDRLIPADDFPGALQSGVDGYVTRQLAGDCAREASWIATGLAHLDREAAARYDGRAFDSIGEANQDALLHEIEAGRTVCSWPSEISAVVFFTRMVELAHEGYYADPGNGGNRDAVSWRMIGYDPRTPNAASPHSPRS